MSQIGDIIDGLETRLVAALPSYAVQDTYRHPDEIGDSALPIAMIFNPQVSIDRLQLMQQNEVSTMTVLLVRNADQAIDMRTDVEAVIADLETNATLAATVDDARVASWFTDEQGENRTYGQLSIETVRVN